MRMLCILIIKFKFMKTEMFFEFSFCRISFLIENLCGKYEGWFSSFRKNLNNFMMALLYTHTLFEIIQSYLWFYELIVEFQHYKSFRFPKISTQKFIYKINISRLYFDTCRKNDTLKWKLRVFLSKIEYKHFLPNLFIAFLIVCVSLLFFFPFSFSDSLFQSPIEYFYLSCLYVLSITKQCQKNVCRKITFVQR